jgi:hypothetical protein
VVREIADGLATPGVGGAVDHVKKNVAAPAVLQRLRHIPKPVAKIFDFLQQNGVVAPGD